VNDLSEVAPLCFVLMPFGRKVDAGGRVTDFDSIYRKIITPAIAQAGLEPVRADEEKIGGTIHKPMFERLMLCPYAVADITGANPNVFYELGIRHALRPRSTVILFREGTILPFDIVLVRGIAYKTDAAGEPVEPETTIGLIAAQLKEARNNPHDDSPLFQLVDDLPRWEIDHVKTDIFRKVVDYSKRYKDRLASAVKEGAEAVQKIASEPGLANLLEVETGIVVDLFLSLRDVKAYDAMIALYDRMPMALQRAKMMREQLGFALNRAGRFEEAEKVLKAVIAEFSPSSETNALLGRVYKDRWEKAKLEGRVEARSLLRRAIDAYVELPVVRYSAFQRAKKNAGYWDHATLLELAVLARDPDDAQNELSEALASESASWEMESTARNLRLVHDMRAARGEDAAWIKSLEEALAEDSRRLAGPGPDTH
jgi:tetratricopeptide (TPR) repeat protein